MTSQNLAGRQLTVAVVILFLAVAALVWTLFSALAIDQTRELRRLNRRVFELEQAYDLLFSDICVAQQGRYSPRDKLCVLPNGNEISFSRRESSQPGNGRDER